MSSFLGKVRNLLGRKQPHPNDEAGALMRIYGPQLENPEALINRANKRAVGGDVDGAIEDFNAAIQLNPAKATAYFNRGYLYNTVGHYQRAADDFSEAIQLLPDYDEAYFQRGISRSCLDDASGAVADYTQALHINPYNIKAYYRRAETMETEGDLQGALADYSQAILQVPKDANAYHRRGILLAKMGEPVTAIQDFTRAIDHNPKHADAYFNRGHCYAQLGDEAQAQQDFSQALLFDPSHEASQYNRAFALGLLKQAQTPGGKAAPPALQAAAGPPIPMAVEDDPVPIQALNATLVTVDDQQAPGAAEAVALTPQVDSVAGYFERAQARAESGDLDGAIADYSQIIEQEPRNSQAYYQRGQSRQERGETDGAIADMEQALHWARMHSLDRLKDFNDQLEQTITTLKRDSGTPGKSQSLEDAIESWSQSIRANPRNAQAYFERGKRRAMVGDLDGAIADYTETIYLDPHHSEAYYNRGRSRSALGDTQGATDDLNHAIRQAPSQTPNTAGPAASRPTPSTCTHAGNLPGNKFCIHCGAPLTPTAAIAASAEPPPFTGDEWYQQGLALVETGDKHAGLQALAKALPLFLEQNKMSRYQETMALMQQFSSDL